MSSQSTTQDMKNHADRKLVSRMLSDTEQFETAIELGLRPEMVTEPAARRAIDCSLKFYESERRAIPNMDYIKMRGIPFHAIICVDDVRQLVPLVRDLSTTLRLTSLMNIIPRLTSGNAEVAAKRVYDTALEISELSKAREPERTMQDLADTLKVDYVAGESAADGGAIPYGFPILSGLLNGKRGKPSVTVFFGTPKSYKTTNLIWDAYCLVEWGYVVYIATGELEREDIMNEMACFRAKVDIARVWKRNLQSEDRLRYFEALDYIRALPNLHIGQCPKRGIMELDLLTSRAIRVKPDVVYLDGVHRLPETPDHQDVIQYAQRVTEHSKHSTGCPWVVAAQANREAAKREYDEAKRKEGGEPRRKGVSSAMLDIAGSKAWIEECTAAIRCVSPGYGTVRLEVTEARYGAKGAVNVSMHRGYNVAEIGLANLDE